MLYVRVGESSAWKCRPIDFVHVTQNAHSSNTFLRYNTLDIYDITVKHTKIFYKVINKMYQIYLFKIIRVFLVSHFLLLSIATSSVIFKHRYHFVSLFYL